MNLSSPYAPYLCERVQGVVPTNAPACSEDFHLELIRVVKCLKNRAGLIEQVTIQSHPYMPSPDLRNAPRCFDSSSRVHGKSRGSEKRRVSLERVLAVEYRAGLGVDRPRSEADVRMQVKTDWNRRLQVVA